MASISSDVNNVNFDNDEARTRYLEKHYQNNGIAIKAGAADTSTDDTTKASKDAKSPTEKQLSPLEKQLFGLNVAAVLLPAPLGTVAGLASAGIKTWDGVAERTAKAEAKWKDAGAKTINDPNKLTDPTNNTVVNTNDRSVLDHHQAVNGMLEGQLNNSRSVFTIKQNQDGTSTLAFKYDDDPSKPGGDERYGQIKLDKDGKFQGDWQTIEKGSSLEKDLDKAHEAKMKEIDSYTKDGEERSKGVERYRAAESVKQDLEVLGSSTKIPEAKDGLAKLKAQLDDKKNIDPTALREDFNEFVNIAHMGDALANNRANALREKGLIDKTDVFNAGTPAEKNEIMDKAINKLRDEQQALTGDKETKLDLSKIGKLSGVNDLMLYGLKTSDQFKSMEKSFSPEEINTLKSLMSASKTLRDSYDPKNPDSTQAKYTRDELGYLNSKIDPFLPRLETVLGTSKSTPRTQSKTIPIPPSPSQNIEG
jgi:hypothetical protein